MKLNIIMKEKISALADGELSDFETRRVLDEISANPEYKEFWRNIQISKEVLTEDGPFVSTNLSDDLELLLGKTQPRNFESKIKFPYFHKQYVVASFLGFFAAITYFLIPQNEVSFNEQASERLALAIESPETIQVLNSAVSELNVELQNIQSNSFGTFASYLVPDSGETFKVSLYPLEEINKIDFREASKISYIRSKDGIYVISISGSLSADKKNKIFQRANYLLTK